jgi:hypothetical protein
MLQTGLIDEPLFQSQNPSVRSVWLGRAQGIGSSWVRIPVEWFAIAPGQPGGGFQPGNAGDVHYRWSLLDAWVRDAVARRQRVLLTIKDAPSWAQIRIPAPASFNSSPNASAVGAFAHALAQRYSGRFPDPAAPGRKLPKVTYFQPWNEPNLPALIAPQWTRNSRGQWVPASPGIYRNILNAVYSNIKAVQPHSTVIAAATAPYGDTPGAPYNRMAPALFWRELLCLHGPRLRRASCPNPAHFDALDHHPYAGAADTPAHNADDVSVPDLWKLQRIVRKASRTHRVLPRGPKPIWVTEIDWSSYPGTVSQLALQATNLSIGFWELWHQRVSHIFWFLIQDYPHRVPGAGNALFGDGLYTSGGVAKPSSTAYRFPFVALKPKLHRFTTGGPRTITIWGKAPQRGTVTIERQVGGTWRTLLRLRTSRWGIFYTRRALGRGLVLRARIGSSTSLDWATG